MPAWCQPGANLNPRGCRNSGRFLPPHFPADPPACCRQWLIVVDWPLTVLVERFALLFGVVVQWNLMTAPPLLLVSVRDPQEAAAACLGGADIIDVKEPAQGPLGFAGSGVIEAVAIEVAGRRPVSAALGECTDWQESATLSALRADLSGQLAFVKLGLAGLETDGNWKPRWAQARRAALASGAAPDRLPAWVAVAYADHQRASSPPPEEILEQAVATGCAALLLDTYVKDGRTTIDWIDEARLLDLRRQAAASGLQFALAGQISVGHTPVIRDLQPDIVAVRGAVCEGSDRDRTVSQQRVCSLKQVLSDLLPDPDAAGLRCPHV